SRSLHERDLKEIGRLRRESEKLKSDQALAAGLVSNMQKEFLQKEQKIQQLQQEIEKLKKQNQEKDKQLAALAARLNCFSGRSSLVLQQCDYNALSSSFFTHFCQVIEKVRQISDENQQSHKREKSLQKELSSRVTKEKETSANIEAFKVALQKLQACLSSPCSSSSLRGELGQLELLCLDPSVSAIRTAVLDMARAPLSWLQAVEQLLDSTGMDLHTSNLSCDFFCE
uniref:Uncharacterized protein n=1 Tax=Malurus cyaneus samueli TaxID=2593467 RepID=A0A8C5TYC2_9PASS